MRCMFEKVLISSDRLVTLKSISCKKFGGIDLADLKDSYDVRIKKSNAEGDGI